MLVLRDPTHVARIRSPEIQELVRQRFAYLTEEEPYDPEDMAFFIVMEDGDALEELNGEVGFDVLRNRIDDTRFDQLNFHQSFEVLEEHQTCYELLFILSDSGYGVDIFIPKEAKIPALLRAMCELYAVPSPERHAS